MSEYADLPMFDDQGNNLVDPNDPSGRKTDYITLVQRLALERYVGTGASLALDLGCGYGRVSGALRQLGWQVVGLDMSKRVLAAAVALSPNGMWCAARLPELPFSRSSFDLVLAQNLLRPMLMNGVLHIAQINAIPDVIRPGGRLVVVDNIWRSKDLFVDEDWIVNNYVAQGFVLRRRIAIRNARWWGIYAVRYGLIPRRFHRALAEHELSFMAKRAGQPRWRYYNVMYVFEKAGAPE